MKTVKDKYLVVGADFAGFPLKEAVVAHLEKKGWKILDLGVKKDSSPNDTDLMFHRVGLRVGAERAWKYISRQANVRTCMRVWWKVFRLQREPLRETELMFWRWVRFMWRRKRLAT